MVFANRASMVVRAATFHGAPLALAADLARDGAAQLADDQRADESERLVNPAERACRRS
jgi:histidine ammonia-lyase